MGHAILDKNQAKDTGILGGPATNPALISQNTVADAASLVSIGEIASAEVINNNEGVLDSLSPATLVAESALGTTSKATPAVVVLDGDGPNATPEAPAKGLPRLKNYFVQPTSGINWSILHPHNAVDIANVCGTPIVAAADGIVVEADSGGNWNGGYGNLIEIEHSNGTATKYAHLQELNVSTGDTVSQGQKIGTIGNTGHVTGVTGCHLHFEVIGAVNPFAKK